MHENVNKEKWLVVYLKSHKKNVHENFNKEKWSLVGGVPEKPLKESARKFQQGKVVGGVT